MRVNYKKELELVFGDYVEVYYGTDNTSKSRSIPCIALFPCCNSTGSWEFMSLKSKTHVCRSQWKVMMTTPTVVDAMNVFDEETVPVMGEPALNIGVPAVPVSEAVVQSQEMKESEGVPVPVTDTTDVPDSVDVPVPVTQEVSIIAEIMQRTEILEVAEDDNLPELEPQGPDDKSDDEVEEEDEDDTPMPCHSARIAGGVLKPGRYAMASTKVTKQKEKSGKRKQQIETAEQEEIK
jgi:hypothetical protein